MLGGVLLHVVTAAAGIDFTVYAGSGLNIFQRSFEVMDDMAVLGVGNFRDAEFGAVIRSGDGGSNPAGVVDLAAAAGVEGGAVENQRWARVFDHLAHFGVKVVEKRIVVVKAVGHWSCHFTCV